MQRIYPTANAPYAARWVTDTHAVEYRYSLANNLYRARIVERVKTDDLYSERFLVERTTRCRTVDEITEDHAAQMIADAIA